MAEYANAGILVFAKGVHQAVADRRAGRFDHRACRPLLLEGKAVCVVGVGGIGHEVGTRSGSVRMWPIEPKCPSERKSKDFS